MKQADLTRYSRSQRMNCDPTFEQARSMIHAGVEKHRAGNLSDAILCYQKALEESPGLTTALYNLGIAHIDADEPEKAISPFIQAISQKPDHAAAHNNLGRAYLLMGDLVQARVCFERALQHAPNMAEAWFNLAELKSRLNEWSAAIEKYRKAIDIDPNLIAAHNNLGNALKRSGRYVEAVHAFKRVLELNPGLAEGHYNIGSAYRLMEDYEQAVLHLSTAIQLHPDYADGWNNLALTCKNIGDFDRASKYFDRALRIDPDLAAARWNRGLLHLMKGEWESGWSDFEARFDLPHWRTIYPHRISGKRWSGSLIRDKTLYVHDEQGLGDTFQFLRFLPWAKARCARLIFETRPEIIPLLDNTLGIDEIVARPENGPSEVHFDQYIPLMSIPRLIDLNPDCMTAWRPYIKARQDKIIQWRALLPSGALRIGLVWAGRPEHGNDINRSCGFDVLAPLFRHEKVQFIGLQKGESQVPVGLRQYRNVTHLGGHLECFSDTSAILDQLDLLISVDTSVAHLAGAMGKKVWVMLPYIPDWRWGISGSSTFWYPTIRLFRQPRPKDWASVVMDIDQSLTRFQGKHA